MAFSWGHWPQDYAQTLALHGDGDVVVGASHFGESAGWESVRLHDASTDATHWELDGEEADGLDMIGVNAAGRLWIRRDLVWEDTTLAALDASTGSQLFSFAIQDSVHSTAMTPDGDIIVAGSTAAGDDLFLSRFGGAGGDLLWTHSQSWAPNGWYVEAIAVRNDGDIVLVSSDESVARFSGANGAEVWRREGVWKHEGWQYEPRFLQLGLNDSGDIVAVGWFVETLHLFPSVPQWSRALISKGATDALVLALSGADGGYLWSKHISGGGSESAGAVEGVGDDFYVCGEGDEMLDLDGTKLEGAELFFVRYTPDGDADWTLAMPTSADPDFPNPNVYMSCADLVGDGPTLWVAGAFTGDINYDGFHLRAEPDGEDPDAVPQFDYFVARMTPPF